MIDTPLFDQDSEFSLIGVAMKNQEAMALLCQLVDAEDFFDERNKLICWALHDMYADGVEISAETVADRLGDNLPKAGHINYLFELSVVSAGYDALDLIRKVKSKTLLRKAVNLATEIHKGFKSTKDPEAFVSKYYELFGDILVDKKDDTLTDLKRSDAAKDSVKTFEENIRKTNAGEPVFAGIPTRYYDLDKVIDGLSPGHLIVVGARPGMGKTLFALNLVRRMDAACLFFSLEMTCDDLIARLISAEAGLDYSNFKKGIASSKDLQVFEDAAAKISSKNLFIDDQPGITPIQIKARVKQLAKKYGIDFIVVDYLQLMNVDQKFYESNQIKVATISRELKGLAKELKVPVVALAQLNRECESRSREGFIPHMSDLRESGSIEADADIIMLLHRPEYYDDKQKSNVLQVRIEKNRHGPRKNIELSWNGATGRIENYENAGWSFE